MVTIEATRFETELSLFQYDSLEQPPPSYHGVDEPESKSRQSEDFQRLVSVTVATDGESVTVDRTPFAGEDPRFVRIDDYRVDAIPHGKMVVTRNTDVRELYELPNACITALMIARAAIVATESHCTHPHDTMAQNR